LSPTLAAVSDEVAERIRAAVADHGPITFAEFMEVALYGPGGFYERPPIGEGGHFVTSPHVHDIFAILLAKALRSMQEEGRFDPFTVVEVGAGDGTLARQLMTELGDLPVEYHAIDRSTGAREELSRLPVTVHPMLEVAPAHIDGCFLANELLDNLPFHRVRQTRNGLREIRIDVLKDGFIEVETPVNDEVM
jgi:SAM-dependent MidA family methyltransferase